MSDITFIENASATYEVIEQNGPPAMHLPFEKAKVGRAVRVDAPVLNPITNEVLTVSNIIYEHHDDGRPPERAYWVGRKLKKCIFGVVKECTVLKFRNDFDTPWEVTEEKAAGKIMSWQKIRDLQHIEDPQKEVAAMQFVSREFHPNVMGVLDVLQDEEYLLMFMPFCNSGDLFGFVQQAGRFPEPMARFWFKQILEGLAHLQKMGVCHRDMSLENILIDEYTKSLVIDLGMCLRVPYSNHNGAVGDVTGGGLRRLIPPLIPCGKPNYISPEILTSEGPFDGFAIDIWACGVILFIMLVGLPPWEFARPEDPRYKMVAKGKLAKMLNSWQKPISPEAADLLQRMLMENPRDRLSLMEIRDHPWVMEGAEQSELPRDNEGWRGNSTTSCRENTIIGGKLYYFHHWWIRMPSSAHSSAQNDGDNNNSLHSLWCATLEIFIHSILFTRHLYPKETFAPTKFLGIQCRVNRHQDVVAYISEAVKVVVPAIFRGTSNRVALELFEHGKSTKREVYFLDFNNKPRLEAANMKLWERDFQNLVLSAYSLDRESPGWKSSATFQIRLLIDDDTKSCSELDAALQNGEWFCPRTDHEGIRLNKTGKIAYEMAQCYASFSFFKE